MDLAHVVGQVQTWPQKTTTSGSLSNPTSRPLYQGTGSWKNKTRRAAGCKCSHKPHLQSAGSWLWIPERAFAFCLQSHDDEEWRFLCQFWVCCIQIILNCGRISLICNRVQCGSLFWLIVNCPFSFRNIAPWLAVILKKNFSWKKNIFVEATLSSNEASIFLN